MDNDKAVDLKNIDLTLPGEKEKKKKANKKKIEMEEEISEEVIRTDSSGGSTEESSEKSAESANKRAKKARKAFEGRDADLSKNIHDNSNAGVAKEKHKKGADYLKSIVYGGIDGIMTAFSIITAAAGAILGIKVILILGLANLTADGIGMGVSDFISEKAEIDHAKAEKKREEWEYDNFPKGEIDEMIQIYKDKGMRMEDAKALVEALTKHRDTFIGTMMVEELGVMNPDPDDNPVIDGCITFGSFILNGIIPLIPFMIGVAVASDFWVLFGVSCVLVGILMFILGAFTSLFSLLSWWKGGGYMFVVGVVGSVASYLIGWGISSSIPVSTPIINCNCSINGTLL
jgi:DNA damage-binding protein 1